MELDSNLISPATDFSLMSFKDLDLMSPALDSIFIPAGARISNVLVGDSSLKPGNGSKVYMCKYFQLTENKTF